MTRLNCDLHPLLTADVLNNLFKNSIFTTLVFIQKKNSFLASITGLEYKQILKIKDGVLFKFSSPLKRGDKYYQDAVDNCSVITTGIKPVDSLLEGGFMTGNIYELCGFEACGKTQLCMSLSLGFCQITPYQVLFIDTKYDVSAQRLLKMLNTQNETQNFKILDKIKICHSTSACKLLNDLHYLKSSFLEAKDNYIGLKIIIIDSLSVLFQVFYDITEGLSILNNIANILIFLASEFHLVIIVTNFVSSWTISNPQTSNSSHKEMKHEPKVHQGLGKYWAHIPSVVINIHKNGCLDECILTIKKGEHYQVGKSVKTRITDAGIV